jgi:Ca2+-binding RTX toxin-like protein
LSTLYERGGDGVNDRIYSKPGSDVVRANAFTKDEVIIFGGIGRDRLNVDDGDERDELYGGAASTGATLTPRPKWIVAATRSGSTAYGCVRAGS